jgi:hypothetical protein
LLEKPEVLDLPELLEYDEPGRLLLVELFDLVEPKLLLLPPLLVEYDLDE